MALMCFHASRTDSRISDDGEIVLLAQQDRNKWNRHFIEAGNAYMNRAAFGDTLSTYHIEAAIAFEYCIAHTFADTNWERILSHYDKLVAIPPTAIIALNRLTVINKIKGGEQTLQELNGSVYLKNGKNIIYTIAYWEKYMHRLIK